MKYVRNMMMDY